MNIIHSGVLAIVLSIFLIHAADPPIEQVKTNFLQQSTINVPEITFTTTEPYLEVNTESSQAIQENIERLEVLQLYLNNIKTETKGRHSVTPNTSPSPHQILNSFLQREGKSEYERLLEKDFVRPLLRLYEKENEQNQFRNNGSSGRISKEDSVEEIQSLTKEELELFMNQEGYYQNNDRHEAPSDHVASSENNNSLDISGSREKASHIRRDDNIEDLNTNGNDEHIGEILPSDYKIEAKKSAVNPFLINHPRTLISRKQSYDNFRPSQPYPLENTDQRYRKPIRYGGERFRPEYEPTFFSTEGQDFHVEQADTKEEVRFVRPNREYPGYRPPRRLRGFPDGNQGSPWNGRRPRVIFPSDLVAFREPNGNEEPDWLAGESNLQDIQEQDTNDRGNFGRCRF